jgi:hypothetical protein
VIQFTEPAEGCGYPSVQMRTEEIMNTDDKDIVSGIALWFAIIAIFAIF